jgi:hypothetical protein
MITKPTLSVLGNKHYFILPSAAMLSCTLLQPDGKPLEALILG